MKVFIILFGLFAFSFPTNSAFAGGCGGDHANTSEDSAKKKQGSDI